MAFWPVQEAKARFSELPEASIKEGPRIVTKRGVEIFGLVPIIQLRLLEQVARPSLKEPLPASEQEHGPELLYLGNAGSSLDPRGLEEKRLLDAVLLAAPR